MEADDRKPNSPNMEDRISCADVETLAPEYVEGMLGKAERRRVEEHLAGCAACSAAMEDMRAALAFCRDAEGVVVPAGLVTRILEETTGKLTWRQRLRLWLRPALEPRLAMGLAMALISFSIIVRASGVDVSQLRLADLRPSRLYAQLDRRAHLEASRLVKYYHDLRVVYEIQTQLQAIRETATPPQPTKPPRQEPSLRPPTRNKLSSQVVYVAGVIF